MTRLNTWSGNEEEEKDQQISSITPFPHTFLHKEEGHNEATFNRISLCDLEESLDNDDEDDSAPDTYENLASQTPIVVGYAFGPKKMSTMSAVMEKASLWDQRESLFQTSLSPHPQQQQQQHVVFTVGDSDLGLILGRLAASSDESMGTCTASHASSSTTAGRSRQAPWRLPPITFVPVEPEEEVDDDGTRESNTLSCHVILHKLTEDILCTSLLAQKHTILQDLRGVPITALSSLPLTPTEHAAVRRVHRLCHPPPGCLVLDNPVRVQTLLNRANICQTLIKCLASLPRVQCPASTIVTDTEGCQQNGVLQFPLILKPLIAAGTQVSHHMAILFADSPLPEPHVADTSWLAQEYRNHGSVLYKVYVLGDHVSVHPRRSLPDLPATGGKSLWFDSQRPYPRPADFGLSGGTNPTKHVLPPLTVQRVQPIAAALKEAFQLELFGFDVILEVNPEEDSKNGDDEPMLWVVDVNYFPSYKEVPQFPSLLAQFLTQRVISNMNKKSQEQAEDEKAQSLQSAPST
ncbi:inositol-1,3,4-trisphosphate 5/6-kinase / inositol-tetrakisphosphate 1-kinase [Fistulifera solaris]|jgi:inositol-1,3,4-trisphosphate 5/6-kinase/inositol-tetrakisphosphate 1-kinase|uniref:inositol-1,3,4-trisphosphate 5/6-kinase n=1 Tax=Fistulifera solaris TaxID=1519565 RepID=A0A1Z5JB80_FISSO|nr:inositol-1,3,4-trisphosphate 5/6-kinase / inositol-tetrakisphosphate 1-kinase [Fistulifera solaris]|eukprot:GAX11216.1 inositol-1,3,4-trisphosphate 5/6-kinase / inositol-tetrakisphosphate 1-kinase [Fistulifera solaris]